MWLLSLSLVLLSAALHASWNLIVKSGDDKLVAAWLTVLAAPLVLWPLLCVTGLPSRDIWPILLGSGAIHAAYNLALVQAYEHGDLSIVYPVARGLAPLFVAMAAPMLLGERLPPVALAAVILVGGGIAWLGCAGHWAVRQLADLRWAVMTAVLIATYSMVDKVGVMSSNAATYAVVLFGCNAAVMTPYVLGTRGWKNVATAWHSRRWMLVASGLCSACAYLLVLAAMRLTQVSYIAALRESSVVFGAVLGWRALKEPFGRQRLLAASVVTVGLVLLAIAMRG